MGTMGVPILESSAEETLRLFNTPLENIVKKSMTRF